MNNELVESESEDQAQPPQLFQNFSLQMISLKTQVCSVQVTRCCNNLTYNLILTDDMLILSRGDEFSRLYLDLNYFFKADCNTNKIQIYDVETSICQSFTINSEQFTNFHQKLQKNMAQKKYSQKYEKLQQIGSGKNSKVFKLKHKETNEIFAAKFYQQIPPNLQKEINILKQLDHPNLIYYKQFFIQDNGIYIVMNYQDGGTLLDIIHSGYTFKAKQRINFVIDILNGLQFLRIKGIVHRDLKPENILYSRKDKRYKIGDFGLADATKYQYHGIVGTPGYLSPQFFKDQSYHTTDIKSDIYSLGLIYHEVITKTPYYQGKSINEILWNNRRGKNNPKIKSQLFSKIQKKILKLMLHKNIKERSNSLQILQSCEMSQAIKQHLHGFKQHDNKHVRNSSVIDNDQTGLFQTVKDFLSIKYLI